MINFAAGPCKLVSSVEAKLRTACMTFPGTDIPAWSISHRDPLVHDVFDRTVALVREILGVPDNFEVLFTQGGATALFKGWPQNLVKKQAVVDVVMSGHWANEALVALESVASTGLIRVERGFDGWDKVSYDHAPTDEHFLYVVSNETVHGRQLLDWDTIPDTAPSLVVDMSSDIFMRPIPFDRVGMVFASTQKNCGMTGGFALVIVRKDLIEHQAHPLLPAPINFREQLKHRGGLRNTVNPLGILSMLYTLEWIRDQGGVEVMRAQAETRAKLFYDTVDQSEGFYEGIASPELRSAVNFTFRLRDEALRPSFLQHCINTGFVGLKGHKAAIDVFGLHQRASCYNATTLEEVGHLTEHMKMFQAQHA